LKTLLLNPPSFDKFDGGAGARYPATREVTSYWYPTWLAYPAGLIKESRLLDAPSHDITPDETVRIAGQYEFVVIFTSTPGFQNDVRLAEMIKSKHPDLKIAFVGPHVTVLPQESLNASPAIDFLARKEFDYAIAEFAQGKKIDGIAGISFRKNGRVVHNPDRPLIENLDQLPFVTDVYRRDLEWQRYSIPFILHPYVSFYTSRGCPAQCTFCLWPQAMSGHRWRLRSVENVIAEVRRARELFPQAREIFFDDDTFTWKSSRVVEMCAALKPLKITWSCNSRVTIDYDTLRIMKDAGCRLLVVGFESGDPEILKTIRKGATTEQALEFMKHCKRLGIAVHGDFQIGHPGETRETVERSIRFAMQLDPETIQVSISHPYPGTRFYRYLQEKGILTTSNMADESGRQLPNIQYSDLSGKEIIQAVSDFYSRYYFRPRIIFRIVRKAIWNSGERRRLYREAREFLGFRSERKACLTDLQS
jgi:hopanoid biosynthesis associated radical SAM protein HpnJ